MSESSRIRLQLLRHNAKVAGEQQAALFDLLSAEPAAAASAGPSLLSPLAQGAAPAGPTRRPGQRGSLFGHLVNGRQGVDG